MMNVLSVPVVFSTWTGLPARAVIHSLTSSQPLLRQRRPAFPRRLISWSGLATSFSVKTQSGRPAPGAMGGVRVLVAASLRDAEARGREMVRTSAGGSEAAAEKRVACGRPLRIAGLTARRPEASCQAQKTDRRHRRHAFPGYRLSGSRWRVRLGR